MSDYDDTPDDVDESTDEGIRGIRQAKKAAEARAEAAEAEAAANREAVKELAFIKAGLPEDSKTANYFRSTYTGELTPEAIKQAAVDAGIIDDANPELTQAATGQAQMAQAMQGGQTPQYNTVQVGPPHMRINVPAEQAQMYTEFEAALRSGPMGAQKAAEVLARYGEEVGVGQTEALSVSPNTTPLANQSNRIV